MAEQADGDGTQQPAAFDQAVAIGVGLEMIHRFDKGNARFARQASRRLWRRIGCVLMPVPTAVPPAGNSSHGICGPVALAPDDRSTCRAKPLNSCPRRIGVASARCVRPILMILSHLRRLVVQAPPATVPEPASIPCGSPTPPPRESPWGTCRWSIAPCSHGRSDGSASSHAKRSPPIISMARLADDLVGVHVGRRAGAGLIDVDRELIVELAFGHLARGGDDRLGDLGTELAQIAIGGRGGNLDQAESPESSGPARVDRRSESSRRPAGFGLHNKPSPGHSLRPSNPFPSETRPLPPPSGDRAPFFPDARLPRRGNVCQPPRGANLLVGYPKQANQEIAVPRSLRNW